MSDAIFVAVVIAFFAIAVAYVRGCARIVGEGEVVRVPDADAESDAETGAGDEAESAVAS